MDEKSAGMIVFKAFASATTVGSFLMGVPICLRIYRQKNCHEITPFPFIMGLISGVFWFRYGLLDEQWPVWLVNAVGMPIFVSFLAFYFYFKQPKLWMVLAIVTEMLLIVAMVTVVECVDKVAGLLILSWACPILNVITFGAPLAGIVTVFRSRCSDSLPLPLCAFNLMVSSEWMLYGILLLKTPIIIPNAIGVFLTVIQIIFLFIFPKIAGEESRAARFYRKLKDSSCLGFGRKATVVSPLKDDGFNWSQKASNLRYHQTICNSSDLEQILKGRSKPVRIPMELNVSDLGTPPSTPSSLASSHKQLRRHRSLD